MEADSEIEIRATWKESGGAKGKATTGKSGGSWKAV